MTYRTAQEEQMSQLTSAGIAVGAVWVAVLAISVFSPDMVSGSEQQHMPVAAFTAWISGLFATLSVMGFWARSRRAGWAIHRPVAVAVAGLWTVAAGFAIFGPEMVTGTDPTRIPLFAIWAPVVAVLLTYVGTRLAMTVVDEPEAALAR